MPETSLSPLPLYIQEARAGHSCAVARLTNRADPITSVPNEILSAIFEAGCLLPQSRPLDPLFEILVSQVSRHWRNVATNTPSLWIQIVITSRKHNLDMVQAYLTRSRNLSLDIRVDMKAGSPSTSSIIRAITPHVDRWRRLSVQCHRRQWHLSSIFRSLHISNAPLLEYFQISLESLDDENHYEDDNEVVDDQDDSDEEDTAVSVHEIFTGGAVSLKTIRLKDIGLYRCMPPLSAVTTLHLSDAFCGPIFSISCNLQALTHLVLHGSESLVDIRPGSASTIMLPSLSSLHLLSSQSSCSDHALISVISAPLLDHLFVEDIFNDMETVLQTSGFCTSPPRYPLLKSLTLTLAEVIRPSTWKLIARSFATVTDLIVLEVETKELPDVLLPPVGAVSNSLSSTDIPWPCLQTLYWGGRQTIDVEPLSVVLSAALITRDSMGHRLRKLRLPKYRLSAGCHTYTRLQQYTEVEDFESKRWPERRLDDWYGGD